MPKETNIPRQTKPENIEISVNKDGDVFWNAKLVPDNEGLFQKLKVIAVMNPQPEVHIRGDEKTRLRVDRPRDVPVPARVHPQGELRYRTTAQGLMRSARAAGEAIWQ